MRIFKIVAISVTALIGLVLITAVILVIRFDPNDYKPQLTELLESRTGRTIEIADDIEWSLFPWLAIETGGISVSNHREFPDTPFAGIANLSARVRVWPLLRREVELGLITLDGFELDIGTNVDGVANWSDLLDSDTAIENPAGQDNEATTSAIAELAIAGVQIRNGRILWRELGEVKYVISDAEVSTGPIAIGEPVDLTGAVAVLDVASQRRANARISTIAALNGSEVRLSNVSLETSINDADGSERGTAKLVTDTLTITDGTRVSAAAGSIDATASDPPFGAETLNARVTWPSFDIDLNSDAARIENVTTSVNGVTATWTLAGENLTATPTVSGNVDIARVPAERLFAAFGIEAPAELDPAALGEVAGRGEFAGTPGGAMALNSFTLDLLGMAIGVNADLDADSGLAARVTVPPFAPGNAFRALLTEAFPVAPSLDGIATISLDASVTMNVANTSPIEVELRNLALDRARLTGDVAISRAAGATPGYRGSLNASLPDPALARQLLGENFPANLDPAAIGPTVLDARFAYTEATDTLVLDSFSLASFGLDAAGSMTANNLRTAPVIRGRGTLGRFDPDALLTRLGQPTPQTSDPNAFRSAAFAGEFVIDAAQAEFRNANVTLDGMQISGSVSVEDFDAPRYRFDLATDTLDVDRYLPPATDVADDGERTAGDIELASEPLECLDLIGTARVAALRLAGLDFQQVEATLTIGGGRARIDPARTRLYGGTFNGALAVDATGDTPSMNLSGQAVEVSLEPLIVALTGESNIRGTGNFDLNLAGIGETITDTLHTAAGTMSFALTSGAIDGFNLGRTLCAAYNLREKLPQPDAAPAITSFELIRASADVSNGIATTRDLLGRTGYMDLTGTGGISLAEARVNYQMSAALTAAVPLSGCETMTEFVGDSIPFTIDGPLSGPTINPDYREIIRNRVQQEVRDSVEDRLRDRLQDRLRNLR